MELPRLQTTRNAKTQIGAKEIRESPRDFRVNYAILLIIIVLMADIRELNCGSLVGSLGQCSNGHVQTGGAGAYTLTNADQSQQMK